MHESLNQSSIDLGQDPHPFDESTDLNFDMSTASNVNNSNNTLLMTKALPSVNAHSASNNSYTNEFLLLNASTKSNGNNSGIGFASVNGSTDTTMAGAAFPHLSYPSLIPSQSQGASPSMASIANNSFYNHNNNNNTTTNNSSANGTGLPGFLGLATNNNNNLHMDLSAR